MTGFNFNRPRFSTTTAPIHRRDVLRATATLDFPSVATTASATLTVTATGADVGDDVQVFPDAPVAGLVYMAWVSAADEITVRVTNVTGSSIDAASASYRVIVWKAY